MGDGDNRQRVVLVTGANKGIGRAAAEHLAALGMTVLVGARDVRRGDEAAAGIRLAGGDAHAVAPGYVATDSNNHTGISSASISHGP